MSEIAKAFDLIEQAKAIVMAETKKYPEESGEEAATDEEWHAWELRNYLEEANDTLSQALDALEKFRGET